MSETLKREERIILLIDPFTKEAIPLNCTTYPEMEVELSGDVGVDEDGNHVVSFEATFIFKRKKKG